MNVATMLCFLATFLTMYLNNMHWSAIWIERRISHVHLGLARRRDLMVLYLHLLSLPLT